MKWGFLLVALVAIFPLAGWMRRNPSQTPKIWFLIGALPFAVDPLHLYMATVSWPIWPGFVKGVEVSLLDILALAVYFSLPRSVGRVPFRLSAGAYFCAVLLSVFQAGVGEASVFYLWQLARMFLVYSVVAKAFSDERVVPSLLGGMATGICAEALIVLIQRFVFGELQAVGTFGHQNSLGLASHFIVFPCFALILAGRGGWGLWASFVGGLIVVVMTVSRATIGMAGLGLGLLYVVSALHAWSGRKGRIALAFAAGAALLIPIVASSMETRFSNAFVTDYDERAAFELAASDMLSDHPMGIGANNFVVAALQGYYEKAKVIPTAGSLSAHVHNVYLLVAAESGYLGLLTFLSMLFQPLVVAFVWGWRSRADVRGDLLLGFGVSLFVVYLHSLYEWVFVVHYIQYFFALTCGSIAVLARQLGYGRKSVAAASTNNKPQLLKGNAGQAWT